MFFVLIVFDIVGVKLLVDLLGVFVVLCQMGEDSNLLCVWWGFLVVVVEVKVIVMFKVVLLLQVWIIDMFEWVGVVIFNLCVCLCGLLGFVGLCLQILVSLFWCLLCWCFIGVVVQVEQIGLDVVFIVFLLIFMVGVVVVFLGVIVLVDFGVSFYMVDLVVFFFLCEFVVLLMVILMVGCIVSFFMVQIGLMKVNEEIDVICVFGLDLINLLVLLCIIVLLIFMFLFIFIVMMLGFFGGVMVCVLLLDISLIMFFLLLQQDVGICYFVLGMVKVLLFVFVIVIIGCNEGFKVSGSVQLVGQYIIFSVVQLIFVVILLDVLVVLFFMEMGW